MTKTKQMTMKRLAWETKRLIETANDLGKSNADCKTTKKCAWFAEAGRISFTWTDVQI
ncbi:MAG: hypothetical protein SGJ27_30310 [Candidatus Melainabacteria bacterium]|nr:hypothetical protein [Candidatus Melainabacteria bacterium]